MLQTLNTLCFSVYLSTFDTQKKMLEEHAGNDSPLFLSLHISEEMDASYCRKVEEICFWLYEHHYRIIADVSPATLKQFNAGSITELSKKLHVWAVRLDYGFTDEQTIEIGRVMPVVLNASTLSAQKGEIIANECPLVMAMHNFYPRPETGLDDDFLCNSTKLLQQVGIKVLAFIPGDTILRGPLFERLPTLERHRKLLPSVAFAELAVLYGIDGIFLGDSGISSGEYNIIQRYCKNNILSVPCKLNDEFRVLYNKPFTCRVDSPKRLVRFAESREYSCFGQDVEPDNCIERVRGCITIDNRKYKRYTGEIQLIRSSLPADERVNVIGTVDDNHVGLIDSIENGKQFMLIPEI